MSPWFVIHMSVGDVFIACILGAAVLLWLGYAALAGIGKAVEAVYNRWFK